MAQDAQTRLAQTGPGRGGGSRCASVPLSLETSEQIKTAFYAPILTGTHLAESLLLAAGANSDLIKSAEWQATMQQAMDQIREACASLHAISFAEASNEVLKKILASVDEFERFLRLLTPLVKGIEPEAHQVQLNLSTDAFQCAHTALKRLKRPILGPAPRKTVTTPKRRSTRTTRHGFAKNSDAPLRPG